MMVFLAKFGGTVVRYWKVVAVLSAILLALVVIHGWMERECTRREVAIRQAYQKMLDEERARSRAKEREMQTLVYEAEHANQARLVELEAKYRGAVERIGPVRVCSQPARAAGVSRDPTPTAVRDDPPEGDGLPGGAGGRDIGPGLVALAEAADTQTARLIACQDYVRALEPSR
jgi:hypothetical protein